jgi:2-polyprenyl-3-methyl-5-hydroxy-6-metoxy-1,4-benzoquinol methylase
MTERAYWDDRYRRGGTSGRGSVGALRDWKWKVIRKYTDLNDAVDVGCGDLSFWADRKCANYVGIDISPYIIERNRGARPCWKFICAQADVTQDVKADVILCLDLLFHIMSDESYVRTLRNLASYSKRYVFIYTLRENPFRSFKNRSLVQLHLLRTKRLRLLVASLFHKIVTDYSHEIYRDFLKNKRIFEDNGFEMISVETTDIDPSGAMYTFIKRTG